jgi:uracil-DNA glycosylase
MRAAMEQGVSQIAALQRRMRRCRLCAEHGHSIEGQPVFSGDASARILLVGQAPGGLEAQAGLPFVGDAGKRLFGWLARAGLSERAVREQHYMSSMTRCYPGKHPRGRGDRAPTAEEQKLCRAWLDAELELIAPELVVPIGRHAIRAFLGARPLDEVVGSVQQDEHERWIVPLPHPSGASGWLGDPTHQDLLERALRHLTRLRQRLGIPAG